MDVGDVIYAQVEGGLLAKPEGEVNVRYEFGPINEFILDVFGLVCIGGYHRGDAQTIFAVAQ